MSRVLLFCLIPLLYPGKGRAVVVPLFCTQVMSAAVPLLYPGKGRDVAVPQLYPGKRRAAAVVPQLYPEFVCTDGLLLDYLLDLRNPYPPDRRENPITNP
jgi:hypothetical protein